MAGKLMGFLGIVLLCGFAGLIAGFTIGQSIGNGLSNLSGLATGLEYAINYALASAAIGGLVFLGLAFGKMTRGNESE